MTRQSTFQTRSFMSKSAPRNRAPIVIGASLVQFTVIGGVFAFGVFFSALETGLGWSRTI